MGHVGLSRYMTILSRPEQLVGRYMRLLGVLNSFRSRLFRSSLVFSKLREVYLSGQLLQYLEETVGAHVLKNAPFVFRDRDGHAGVGALQMARQVIPG